MRVLSPPLEDSKDRSLNQVFLQILRDLDIMKPLLKNTKENYSKEEKPEEDNIE